MHFSILFVRFYRIFGCGQLTLALSRLSPVLGRWLLRTSSSPLGVTPPTMGRLLLFLKEYMPSVAMSSCSTVRSSHSYYCQDLTVEKSRTGITLQPSQLLAAPASRPTKRMRQSTVSTLASGTPSLSQSAPLCPSPSSRRTRITPSGFMIITRAARAASVLSTTMSHPARHSLALRCVWLAGLTPQLSLSPHISCFGTNRLRITSPFQRNAIRLNGTASSDGTSTSTSFRTSSATRPSPSASARNSASERAFTVGAIGIVPLLIAGIFV